MRFFLLGSAATLVVVPLATFLLVRAVGVLKMARVQSATPAHASSGVKPLAPWGNLEPTEVSLANPEGMFPDQAVRLQKPRWFFENYSEARLTQLLLSCDLSSIQRKVLLDRRFWSIETNGCVITPPEPIIWYLNSSSRRKIYSVLAQSPTNFAQCYPFRFPPGTFDEFLTQSGLSAQDATRVNRLAYPDFGAVCFTDLEAVQTVLTPDEFDQLIGALYSTPAFCLRLHVTPYSDVDALVKYWGKGGREKLIKPLLKALGRVPGGAVINVSMLLPPFARTRLYTYPDAWDEPAKAREDCFFTALNFFNKTVNTNFFDANYSQATLKSDYVSTRDHPTYGDLIAVRNASGDFAHMCVYIAADFVFTKNGVDRAAPWVLMRMSDMLKIYHASESSGQVTIFRRRLPE